MLHLASYILMEHLFYNIKVVKAIVREDDVWVVSEFLIDKDPKFGDMIPRMINMLKNARVAFYDAIKNL